MKVNTEHSKYSKFAPFWQRMRDAVEGEDTIKDKGEVYLPVPPGLNVNAQSADYQNYKSRARYPETVSPAIEGMVGLMNRKLNPPELPGSLQYLLADATPDGLSLFDLRNRMWHEVCTVGRYILFVDVPTDGGKPYIATYPAESVINWKTDGERTTLIVFAEVVDEPDPVDMFKTREVEQWRVAAIVNEVDDNGEPTGRERYAVQIWRRQEAKEDEFIKVEETFPTRKGKPMDYVPAVFVGSRDITPEPDAIPLLGVANKSLHYYRQYADYAMQLFMCANGTTPYVFGTDSPPQSVGPTTVIHSESEGASAGYLEVSGTGLEAQKNELENIKSEIAFATVRVLGDNKAAEAAETLRLRFQSQTATLTSISKSTAAGLETALRMCAEWLGANPDEIEVPAEAEFISEQADAQLITALYDGIERGFVPDQLLIDYLKQVELHNMQPEDYRKWMPAAMRLEDAE